MSRKPDIYPFLPKSTARLRPGHFWPIQLTDGRFACGRVIQLQSPGAPGATRMFIAGLMDWVGPAVPSDCDIANRRMLDQGKSHIRTISETCGDTGGVSGFRDLSIDGLGPDLSRNAMFAARIVRGFDDIGPADANRDAHLPVLSTWGYRVIAILANKAFSATP